MKRILTFILSLISISAIAQIGGTRTYDFLNVPNNARVMALGGKMVSMRDRDLNLAYTNPALLSDSSDGNFAINYTNYLADISGGYIAYAKHYEGKATFSAGMHYMNYGKFDGRDETGAYTGEFTAGDYAFHLTGAKEKIIDNKILSYGTTLKFIYSSYEQYTSTGAAIDLGGHYFNPDKNLNVSLAVRNLGAQITTYTDGNREPLPMDIQLGASIKPQHMPFRFYAVAHSLQKPDLTFNNPNTRNQQIDLETGQPIEEKITLGDKIFRHFTFGTELSNNSGTFYLRAGYNHQRRSEMTVDVRKGTVGFSWGFGLKIRKLHLSYGSAAYFIGQATNQFSIITNLYDYKKKK